ncbi:hypothetical protein HK098_002311 [Nowakowskiella sp. JEL0407]|nr:hypothetical protein HK098_002311 [Nowakowskiella sp. JEL0407]
MSNVNRTPRKSGTVSFLNSPARTPPNHQSKLRSVNTPNGTPRTPGTPGLLPANNTEDLRKSYEDFMKIVADNKINATNSWNVALIDYFKDMRVLREGDSINFQKASCTLDGCVKIYSSRVDSVDTETRKLLNGLADRNSNGEDLTSEPTKKRSTTTRSQNTLAKDASSINVKEYDLEKTVDPLFKKTCADFDEGGAKGLLLNHLCISSEGRVVFDAGDANLETGEQVEVDDLKIDLRRIKDRFWGGLKDIWKRDVCPSLKDFKFNSNDVPTLNSDLFKLADLSEDWEKNFTADYDNYNDGDDDDNENAVGFELNQEVNQNLDDVMSEIGFVDRYDENGEALMQEDIPDLRALVEPVANQVSVAVRGGDEEQEDGGTEFGYFDQAVLKTWAGPEHWRPQRVRPIKVPEGKSVVKEAKKTTRKKKESILDFFAEPVDLKGLFATSKTSIDLPKTAKPGNIYLPEDFHFSAEMLLTLFTNPDRKVGFKTKKSSGNGVTRTTGDGEINAEAVWENASAQPDNQENVVETNGYFFNDDQDGDDDDDDIGATDAYGTPGGIDPMNIEELSNSDGLVVDGSVPMDNEKIEELLQQSENAESNGGSGDAGKEGEAKVLLDYGDQLVSQPKKVRMIGTLNFARTAKRVDVKKLKDNIWYEITGSEPIADDNPFYTPPEPKLTSPKKLTEVIGGLTKIYQPKKMRDISVAFCFICVLHLANEKNLEVGVVDLAGEDRSGSKVGKKGDGFRGRELVIRQGGNT